MYLLRGNRHVTSGKCSVYLLALILSACVVSGCGGGSGGGSGGVQDPPADTLPSSPTGLAAQAVSGSQINLTWTDNSSNETGFKIQRNTGLGFADLATLPADTSTYSDTGLASTTTYSYRVCACSASGNSSYSDSASATTQMLIPEDAHYVDQGHPSASNSNTGTEALPFLTIAAAISHAGSGGTVVVKAGTYREAIAVPGGTADNPFQLIAYPGDRVIVSGMEVISGWQLSLGVELVDRSRIDHPLDLA